MQSRRSLTTHHIITESTTMSKPWTTITADELARELAAGRVTELWNALVDEYFTGEMIPGSRRVPVDQVGREVAGAQLPKETPIVTYCSGSSCPNSTQAAEKLATFGFTSVRAFEGGLEAWKASGRAVETFATV